MLKQGDSSAAVKVMQARLVKLGYTLSVDGSFGPRTEAAVRDFQTKAGLAVDGLAGPVTLDAIDKALGAAPTAPPPKPSAFDADGWYTGARRCLTPLRMGAAIEPKGATVHTTDCMPGSMQNILRRWAQTRDSGAGAHFMIGRRAPTFAELADEQWPSAGIVQMIPIKRNGNHAGGPGGDHGWLQVPGAPSKVHPNLVYVGIEIDCGGKLRQMHSKAMHVDSGTIVDEADVFRDERGAPWHRITDYQFEALGKLLDDLDAVMGALPAGTMIVPNGSYQRNGVTWAALPGTRFVTHVALDPIRKTDPGPQATAWLREHYGR
jgi:hypothetical protein